MLHFLCKFVCLFVCYCCCWFFFCLFFVWAFDTIWSGTKSNIISTKKKKLQPWFYTNDILAQKRIITIFLTKLLTHQPTCSNTDSLTHQCHHPLHCSHYIILSALRCNMTIDKIETDMAWEASEARRQSIIASIIWVNDRLTILFPLRSVWLQWMQ